MDYNKLIDTIVKEVLKRLENSKKSALVIFTGGTIGFNEAVKQLNRLKDDGWNLKVFLSRNGEKILTPQLVSDQLKIDEIFLESNVLDEKALLKDIGLVVIPVLTMNSAAKIALGISDTMATHLTASAIMRGIPIVAAKDACDPKNQERVNAGFSNIPPAYEKRINSYLEDIQEYGIRLVESHSLYEVIFFGSDKKCKAGQVINKKLITREDIILAKNNGYEKIRIAGNSIVTSLAKDTASELGVGIECI